MFRFLLSSFLIIVVTLAGCTSTKILGSRTVSSSQVHDAVRSHQTHIQSLKAEGEISIESPRMAQTGSFKLTLLKPDSVLISLHGPFGIKVGTALVTRTGFLFYSSFENKLISGASSEENLNRILHVQMNFDDMLNLFSGGGFSGEDVGEPDEISIADEQYVFVYGFGNSSRRYWIDPATLLISKVQFLDSGGTIELEQAFEDYQAVNGIQIPSAIRISQPKERQTLSLSYSEITVNAIPVQFSFTVPATAERIHWQ